MSVKGIFTVGRRKNAIARVKLMTGGTGEIVINDRKADEYLPVARLFKHAIGGLELTDTRTKYNLKIRVSGGGVSGQAGAIRMGIARALQKDNVELRETLKKAGHLMRDSRMVERKKYGLRKARRATQFSKR